jgi:hypothetical protein
MKPTIVTITFVTIIEKIWHPVKRAVVGTQGSLTNYQCPCIVGLDTHNTISRSGVYVLHIAYCVCIHLEHQAQGRPGFDLRMFRYFARLYDQQICRSIRLRCYHMTHRAGRRSPASGRFRWSDGAGLPLPGGSAQPAGLAAVFAPSQSTGERAAGEDAHPQARAVRAKRECLYTWRDGATGASRSWAVQSRRPRRCAGLLRHSRLKRFFPC